MYIREKILEKNFSFPCGSTKYQTKVVPFLYGPILPQRSHFIVGLWWATGPTLPQYWPNFTPNYGVMMSRWIFSVLFELIIVNWNPFQRWFSEVALVSWHINFISRSYGLWLRCKSKACNFWLFFTPLDWLYTFYRVLFWNASLKSIRYSNGNLFCVL